MKACQITPTDLQTGQSLLSKQVGISPTRKFCDRWLWLCYYWFFICWLLCACFHFLLLLSNLTFLSWRSLLLSFFAIAVSHCFLVAFSMLGFSTLFLIICCLTSFYWIFRMYLLFFFGFRLSFSLMLLHIFLWCGIFSCWQEWLRVHIGRVLGCVYLWLYRTSNCMILIFFFLIVWLVMSLLPFFVVLLLDRLLVRIFIVIASFILLNELIVVVVNFKLMFVLRAWMVETFFIIASSKLIFSTLVEIESIRIIEV